MKNEKTGGAVRPPHFLIGDIIIGKSVTLKACKQSPPQTCLNKIPINNYHPTRRKHTPPTHTFNAEHKPSNKNYNKNTIPKTTQNNTLEETTQQYQNETRNNTDKRDTTLQLVAFKR